MTVRMAQQIGMPKRVVKIAHDFGIADKMGAYLPMALGAVDTTLLRMTMAHAMLANGAREITPSLIDRVQDRNGKTIYRHEPRACSNCGEATDGQKPTPPAIVDKRQPFHDPGHGLPGGEHDDGRDRARHRGPARDHLSGPADRRQDRHDQRQPRHLVHRLRARPHDRRLCRLRRAAHARTGRSRAA